MDKDGVWNECDYCRRKVDIAHKARESAGDSAPKDTRPYKERFPEQYCLNCGQWLGGGTACCGDPKSPTAKVIEYVPDSD